MKTRLSVLLWLLLFSASLLAQTFRGTILGTVTDPQGAVVAGAKVTVHNVDTGLDRTTQTSADGSYSLPELPIGTYTVTVTQSGFQTAVTSNVAVNVAINKQVSSDLERAELITFPIVAILLLIVFGSLVAASLPLLIGGVAIMGAFAILRAIAGWTDVSIYAANVVTMLGLGLAIDYALFIVTRFREELGSDDGEVKGAIERTMSTAGRTIMFSGLTISTSLLGLLIFPVMFLRSIGAIAPCQGARTWARRPCYAESERSVTYWMLIIASLARRTLRWQAASSGGCGRA